MIHRHLVGLASSIVVVSIVGACSAATPSTAAPTGPRSAGPSASLEVSVPPASVPSAIAFDAFIMSACSAFDSMFVAVGNPDTGSGSVLSKQLDQAVEAKDGAAADRVAAVMTGELEAGRRHAAEAGRYPSGSPMMTQMDRVLAAFVVMVAAKRAIANGTPGAVDPQTAFEGAGGVDAWLSMLAGVRDIDRPSGEPPQTCPTVPVSL